MTVHVTGQVTDYISQKVTLSHVMFPQSRAPESSCYEDISKMTSNLYRLVQACTSQKKSHKSKSHTSFVQIFTSLFSIFLNKLNPS
jgi:hypothetical protein